jgi:uncharacterized protein
MPDWSRRTFLQAIAASAQVTGSGALPADAASDRRPCRIRTITAGVTVPDLHDLRPVEAAIAILVRGRAAFTGAGYEVQTIRIALSPFVAALKSTERERALESLRALDKLLQGYGATGSIGPCAGDADYDPDVAPWVAELIRTTTRLSCSIRVATPDSGVFAPGARMAAEAIAAISRSTPGGLGNFRFAAAACVPAGTPFFPVAFHQGPSAIAIGLESASLVERGIAGAQSGQSATSNIRDTLNQALVPVERLAAAFAAGEGCGYLGIDPSPAPAIDRSIGAALEALLRRPFGGSGTVDACAAVTASLRGLDVKTCGYAGLMLPVLEDPVLARRASEGHFGVRDLLLFSSVCGTGLDLVPLPGDTPVEVLERIVRDTAALASRWTKPLSARLFLVPGKKATEMASFADPLLTDCRVMDAG